MIGEKGWKSVGWWEILKGEQPGPIKSILNFENVGQFGEFSTEFALTNHNLDGDLVVLKNIYIPMKRKTTEIDLMILHEKGIYVFESKNYSGWIFGDSEQLNWTQSLPNGEKHRFYNPIRQNRTHIRALADYLGMEPSAFKSYIVFSQRCTLKKVPLDTEDVVIVRRLEMLKKLRAELKRAPVCYSHEMLQEMEEKIRALTGQSEEEKQRHIEDLRTKCPYCGSPLVRRKGKYGPFWGCGAYPRCRYTRREEEEQ